MDLIQFFQIKEDFATIKLQLIKIAAMLNEDENYTKEEAFKDLVKLIHKIETDGDPSMDTILEDLK